MNLSIVAALSMLGVASAASLDGDVELGRQIYREGRLPSGEELHGSVLADVELAGAAVACATCHRRSGFGESEGGLYVPPVTGPALFGGAPPTRSDLQRPLFQEQLAAPAAARVHDPRARPPYTAASLARGLREGRDPSGRLLGPAMPRYEISAEDAAHLAAYLATLGARQDPGVDRTTIHFATVVASGVDREERQAMLDVVEAYVEHKNRATRGLLAHPGSSPWHRDELGKGYREWAVHVWELDGAPETWRRQLSAALLEQPVFAVLAGLGQGPWRPIHEFCEEEGIPCLFPATALPVESPLGDYALYLAPGPEASAGVLARHLTRGESAAAPVIQVFRASALGGRWDNQREETAWGALAAAALRAALGAARLDSRELSATKTLSPVDWEQLATWAGFSSPADASPILVLWLGESDVAALDLSAAPIDRLQVVYLARSLVGDLQPPLDDELRQRIWLLDPFAPATPIAPRRYRVRSWLRARRVERRQERLQLDAFFALSVADHAIAHLVDRFDRDYFVERVEHEVENGLSPGVYPYLSLGPGQRFAAPPPAIVRIDGGGEMVTSH